MKTTIFSILTVVVLSTISNLSTAASINNVKDKSTVVAEASSFNKIEVRGNVELFITDGAVNSVKAYNNYYGESALVQNQNGTLRVSSYAKDKLVVFVTAAQLRAISVYDNSVVKSFNGLSTMELDVNLYNNASAQLDLDAIQVNVSIADRASANLAGNVNECGMSIAQSSTVNSSALKAVSLTKTVIKQPEVRKHNQELASI